jgi:2-polyprenyl-3-methyl-5-hydroxy-6-metoxy-1,4-benzoquinol methylase
MSQHYGPDYDEFIRKATEGDAAKHWQGPLATVLRHCQSGKLLDLGCGAGSFLNSIRGTPWELYGVELSGTAAQRAREKTGADVFTGDILDAPFAPARFDVVTCFHVFEHLYSPDEVLQKVWTWLKPGGIFCVHVPNIESAEARCFGSYWYGLELPRHLFHFSPDSLRQLARSTAFHEVELATRRTSFVEYSTRYLVDDIMGAAGVRRKSLAVSTPPSMTWRILRKCLRLTLLPLASSIISVKGEGEVLEAVLSKPA